jgi:anti-anti-sigma regulatory factor
MTLRISQILDAERNSAVLRLEGTMSADEAVLLEGYCGDLARQSIPSITLDLEGLTFLDEESGAAIRRLRQAMGVTLIGSCLFTHEVIEGGETFDPDLDEGLA